MTKKEAQKLYEDRSWILRNMSVHKNCVIPNEMMECEDKDKYIKALELLCGRAIRIDTVYTVDYTFGNRMEVIKNKPTYIAEFD